MEDQNRPIQTRDGHTVLVDFFRPKDGEGIAALFRQVYGDGYPVKLYYEPEALIRANASGDCCSIVARNEAGEVVGATAAIRSAPYAGIYESAAGLVLKAYRNHGISERLQWFLLHRWVQTRPQVDGVFGEPVCNHLHVQKNWHDLGAVEMGLEVALMPASAYGDDQEDRSRVACLAAYYTVSSRPHRVYLPPVYADALRFLYSGLSEERSLSSSAAALPSDRSTQHQVSVFDFASVARVAFHETGLDLKDRLKKIERDLRDQGVRVIQVWLRLGSPWVGAATDLLRDEGYFLGGVLPRWFDDDGLLMQKLLSPPDWEGIHLYTDRAREILSMVKQDRDRIRAAARTSMLLCLSPP
jgi:hypothetical protein